MRFFKKYQVSQCFGYHGIHALGRRAREAKPDERQRAPEEAHAHQGSAEGSGRLIQYPTHALHDALKDWAVAIVGRHTPNHFSVSLHRGELPATKRLEQKPQLFDVLAQKASQQYGVIVAGVVEHRDDAAPASPVVQQLIQETLGGLGVEYGADETDELPNVQFNRTDAYHETTPRACGIRGSLSSGRPTLRKLASCCREWRSSSLRDST